MNVFIREAPTEGKNASESIRIVAAKHGRRIVELYEYEYEANEYGYEANCD